MGVEKVYETDLKNWGAGNPAKFLNFINIIKHLGADCQNLFGDSRQPRIHACLVYDGELIAAIAEESDTFKG